MHKGNNAVEMLVKLLHGEMSSLSHRPEGFEKQHLPNGRVSILIGDVTEGLQA